MDLKQKNEYLNLVFFSKEASKLLIKTYSLARVGFTGLFMLFPRQTSSALAEH